MGAAADGRPRASCSCGPPGSGKGTQAAALGARARGPRDLDRRHAARGGGERAASSAASVRRIMAVGRPGGRRPDGGGGDASGSASRTPSAASCSTAIRARAPRPRRCDGILDGRRRDARRTWSSSTCRRRSWCGGRSCGSAAPTTRKTWSASGCGSIARRPSRWSTTTGARAAARDRRQPAGRRGDGGRSWPRSEAGE